jgi:hypothetical protein
MGPNSLHNGRCKGIAGFVDKVIEHAAFPDCSCQLAYSSGRDIELLAAIGNGHGAD